MAEKRTIMVHECGAVVTVIEDGIAPHFIYEELHMDVCPRCFRNLLNDWMDERWRFWTPRQWEEMRVWSDAIDGLEEKR